MLRRRLLVAMTWLGAAVLCAAAPGCSSSRDKAASSFNTKGTAFASTTAANFTAARGQAMAAADTYMTIVAQAVDELRAKTKRQEVVIWAMQQRSATAIASCTNATGTNDYIGLLDMLVLSTLKRYAIEEHWIPNLLHEEGTPVLEGFRRAETDVWKLGEKALTPGQVAELRQIIEQWRKDNPTQYYVSHIRFTDFANAMRVTSSSSVVKVPSSVFGLLYIDPLAGLDPVSRELQQYRALTERILFVTNRMPLILSSEIDLAMYKATNGPELVRFVDNTQNFAQATSRFADHTKRFADAIVKFPKDLTVERTAAIEQLNTATTQQVKGALDQTFAGIAEQRQAITKEIEGQESRLRTIIGDVRGVVERADEAGKSLNTATSQTIGTTEQATRRTITHAFVAAGAFVIVSLISLLLYRFAVKRWALQAPAIRQT